MGSLGVTTSTVPHLFIFETLLNQPASKIAIIDPTLGQAFSYGQLVQDVAKARDRLHQLVPEDHRTPGSIITFMVESGYRYVVTLLSVFAMDCVALSLNTETPVADLLYVVEDSKSPLLIASAACRSKIQDLASQASQKPTALDEVQLHDEQRHLDNVHLVDGGEQAGIVLYTSGTTNRPKGVVHPCSVVAAQCRALIEAWEYTSTDVVLNTLPMHHIHGILTKLLVPLLAGATVELYPRFDPLVMLERIGKPYLERNTRDNPKSQPASPVLTPKLTVISAVPTMYAIMCDLFPSLPPALQTAIRTATSPSNLRLNVSGSSALPSSIRQSWAQLTGGNQLVDRYGTTEVGIVLSLAIPFTHRIDTCVGWPLPGIELRMVDLADGQVIEIGHEKRDDGEDRLGEIQVRGPTVFQGYLNRSWQETKAANFASATDGRADWFRTGDIAVRRFVDGTDNTGPAWATGPAYFIRGRSSIDMIKSAGERISALEIERELLLLPQVREASVLGVPSPAWGQKIAAVVSLYDDMALQLQKQTQTQTQDGESKPRQRPWGLRDMRRELLLRLAPYKVPHMLKIVDQLPRNSIGKVNKSELVKQLYPDGA